jgi:hypothetical protein
MRRPLSFLSALCVLAWVSLSAQGTTADRVAGQWEGDWGGAHVTLTLKKADAQAPGGNKTKGRNRNTDLTGTLSVGEVEDPLRAPNGPKTVTPTSDVTGSVDGKGVVELTLTYPDLEGRSEPDVFTGTVTTDAATKQDTLTLASRTSKLTLKRK